MISDREVFVTEDNVIEEIEFLFMEQVRAWREDGMSENEVRELMEDFFESACNHFDIEVLMKKTLSFHE
jgi:hypothetical protein